MKSVFALLALTALVSASQVAELHVLRSPEKMSFKQCGQGSQSLAYSEVAGLMSHAVGVAHEFFHVPSSVQDVPSGSFFDGLRDGVMVVISGVEMEALKATQLYETSQAHFIVENDEGRLSIDQMVTGEREVSILEAFALNNAGQGAAVAVSGDANLLKLLSFRDAILSEHSTWRMARVLVENNSLKVAGKSDVASRFAALSMPESSAFNVMVNGRAVFDATFEADRIFLQEMDAAMIVLKQLKDSKFSTDKYADLVVVGFSGLQKLKDLYGTSSEQYQFGLIQTLKMVGEISAASNENAIVQALFVSSNVAGYTVPTVNSARRRAVVPNVYKLNGTLERASPYNPCFISEAFCLSQTGNCTNQGMCTQLWADANEECWKCKCDLGYAGDNCQFIDFVGPFQTAFWTAVLLVITITATALMLCFMDNGKDNLMFASGSRPKTE